MSILDKEEFRVKLEEINHLVEKKDYEGAMKVVDSIDWRRVKNVRTLCVVGEIYAANKRYEESREIFLLAYHRAPIGKNILYRLIEVSLKMGDVEEAKDYYQEFIEVASDDHTQYILNYKILTAQNAPVEERIEVLEKYKEKEFTEKWSYELAKLYYQAGQRDKCLALCNEMNLWFHEGSYVTKAMELKEKLGDFDAVLNENDPGNQPVPETEDTEVRTIGSISVKNEKELAGVESIQEKISKGLRDIFGNKKEESAEEYNNDIPEEIIREKVQNDDQHDSEHSESSSEPDEINVDDQRQDESDQQETEDEGENNPAAEGQEQAPVDTARMPQIRRSDLKQVAEDQEQVPVSDDFNLEDTILAAASRQGIEIPEEMKENPEASPETENETDQEHMENAAGSMSMEDESKESADTDQEKSGLEEEEFLTEEDLALAEQEFLGGPMAATEIKKDHEPASSFVRNSHQKQEDLDFFDDTDQDVFSKPVNNIFDKEMEERLLEVMDEEILDIIPREKVLNEEEKKLFTYFVKVPGMKEQLIKTLCDVQDAAADKTSKTGNIIVMGGRETGKTRLISALIPAICSELNLEATKVAYVFAQDINGKNISSIIEKLAGGFLVIEDANQLTLDTVNQLNKAMEFNTEGMFIILEDEKIGMRKMMARYPKFARKFTSMIHIPVFTNDELVNFAIVYTIENGYKIDQMGMLALYNKIGENQKEDEPMNIGAVKQMLDAAIEKSQRGILKLGRKKRQDKDGFTVLHEKDFA